MKPLLTRNCVDSLTEAIFERSNTEISARDLAPPQIKKRGDFWGKGVNRAIARPGCNTGSVFDRAVTIRRYYRYAISGGGRYGVSYRVPISRYISLIQSEYFLVNVIGKWTTNYASSESYICRIECRGKLRIPYKRTKYKGRPWTRVPLNHINQYSSLRPLKDILSIVSNKRRNSILMFISLASQDISETSGNVVS